MDIVRAFTYVFDDPKWLEKLAIMAIITAFSIVLTPVLVGLLGWAALLGYAIELVRNVRLGIQNPLPPWNNLERYVVGGANLLVAVVVYSLPNLLLAIVSIVLGQNMGSGFIGSSLVLVFSCCMFPMFLIYNLIAVPTLAVGIGRYVEDPRINVFFEFSFLYEALRHRFDRLIQWWISVIVANLVFAVLAVIPLVGWVVLAALLVPVYGMLTGQFALIVLGGLKGKGEAQGVRR